MTAANTAWLHGDAAATAPLWAHDAVLALPDGRRLVGRAALVQSIAGYLNAAETHEFEELDPHIDVLDDLAVATYAFRIRYRLVTDPADREEIGRERLVLRHRAGSWQVVWREQSPA
ncbi:MAG: DUF4440 domain-containing protein [Planctomycetota bacterium]